jgi:hypothetical protein
MLDQTQQVRPGGRHGSAHVVVGQALEAAEHADAALVQVVLQVGGESGE